METVNGQTFLTIEDYEPLKLLYVEAVHNNKESFTYNEKEILVNYAKYVLEYMEIRLNKK